MVEAAKTVVRFGVFEFDAEAGELRRNGKKVHLAGQPVEILALLLDRPGRVVTREELRSRLWPADTFVEFEHSLNAAVMRLRQALGDSAETPRYVETLPKRGYRFLAEVRATGEASSFDPAEFVEGFSSATMPAAAPPNVIEPAAAPQKPRGKRWIAVALMAALPIVIAVAALTWRLSRDERPRINSVAVLPLANFSSDPEQEFFADGMTEELTTDLSKIEALRVISRTSAMRYKGTKKTVPEIARELNVEAVIEGSVQRQGERVRITVQLVQASSEAHLWSASYDRELTDVLKLRTQLARDVAEQVRMRLTAKDEARIQRGGTRNVAAYDAFLKGRHLRDRGQWSEAVPYLRDAVEKDPNYALAWVNLALALGMTEFGRGSRAGDESLVAGMRACVLDQELSECHAFLGAVQFWRDWNWNGGITELRRALELDAGSEFARLEYGSCLLALGRNEAALEEFTVVQKLDPTSPLILEWKGRAEETLKRFDDAQADYLRAVELDAHFTSAYFGLSRIARAEGDPDLARDFFLEGLRQGKTSPSDISDLARAYAAGRWEGMQRRRMSLVLQRLAARSDGSGRGPTALQYASIYAAGADKEHAIRWLQSAFEQHTPRLAWLKNGPDWETVRADPRVQELIRKMNYPD